VSTESSARWLIVRVGLQLGALPLEHVVETMRPLPVRAVPGVPAFVRGLAIVRGVPTPVVDAAVMLGDDRQATRSRFVALRTVNGPIALAVDDVLGVREIGPRQLAELPPLLAGARDSVVSSLGMLDGELLIVLRAGKLLPEDAWPSMTAGSPS
jgi:purine-binding chemotaxis protein CheW